jgi:hypothetical protein
MKNPVDGFYQINANQADCINCMTEKYFQEKARVD